MASDEAQREFDRVSGKETTWVLQSRPDSDSEWLAYRGLFVRSLADAEPLIASAKSDRPDMTEWRTIDRATQTVLAYH